ncbi:hypothetical protein JCM15548_14125 [Geofilum rubicundum JCM 15548]|uniref:Uncharacterized protein n=2 Tax=Geofilum TaxID=1236988 RepID=A0A0E9M2U9_9BACT|nr:hypothetical protein JCM15548_14125 [Geofilum rubicundum JCM 15548]
MILVELKGTNIEHAAGQLAATKYNRPEYREIKEKVSAGARGATITLLNRTNLAAIKGSNENLGEYTPLM